MIARVVLCLAFVAGLARPALAAPTAPSASTSPLRRFALVIGSNNGGSVRERLRYAAHDAETVADVFRQLGGVDQIDLAMLSEPDSHGVDQAFDALSERVRGAHGHGQRVELVVYYSGHADESGILLSGEHYDYARLRRRISDVPADVHIAIVDSCASGSFTRAKGGARMPPFLRDTSNQVHGFAFLSSSSADEDAQESDRIGASFFTYFFVGGLRGAADRNHDGKITLTEAYQFAYEQTLGRTQNTAHGPQHPAYDMHLSGTGDVVITDLRSTEATLVLPAALRGRITVVDKSGRVAVELTKEAGEPLSLALPNATYAVHVDNGKGELVATVTLDHGGELAFAQDALRRATPEQTVARGGVHVAAATPDAEADDAPAPDAGTTHHHRPSWREFAADFAGGLRVERPSTPQRFDALVTLGGTSREVHGTPVIGVAETMDFSLGATLGDKVGFAYDMSFGFGPGVFLGDNLQIGATIGFGFSGITGGILDFGWKVPTEAFAILELSKEIRPMAYVRQDYVFGSDSRKNGSSHAKWGDEAEAGAGLQFSGALDGFVYGSVREMAGVRYWGIGMGAVL
ncbi:MAG TPA: caspase family protein [Kofleriaceae bacterium]|nr:caspase family protein [Kofleriaceae bacterium]